MDNINYNKIQAQVRKSYANSCICWIEEIINDKLLLTYQKHKSEIEDKTEYQLFHGTSRENADCIIKTGFNYDKNVRSLYGKGTYFAADAMYSFNYMTPDKTAISYMFLCDVIDVNSDVANLTNKNIFIITRDDAAFPKYLIAFHKYAKM